MQLTVIGDIHTQERKLWRMLLEAGIADAERQPTAAALEDDSWRLVLLGDVVHAKTREVYSHLAEVEDYDEYNPEHRRAAELSQEAFLRELKAFQEKLPADRLVILMGNHDFNAISPDQGPLRTGDITHLEWKEDHALPDDLRGWISGWPHEFADSGIHFAHVGPLEKHNTYDQNFYLENRRSWLMEDRDFLADTPYRLGVYGHTPVRGGLNLASQGKAILLDTNGTADEYSWLRIRVHEDTYRVSLQGLYFDEIMQR
ncbi:MAG TPA: metallophosphoesterase [Deinococcales bacterium]|nr:metallophosphoesterase [Deinococcales bacterium]